MKKSLIALVLMTFAATAALAYPGPDSMGIYMVDDAVGPVDTCIDLEAFAQVTLYMCLTNPSGDQVLAWEANVTKPAAGLFGAWTLVSGINVSADPDFIVGLGDAPLTPNEQGVVVLMTMDALVMDASVPLSFYIDGVEGSVSFPNGNPGYQAVLGFMTDAMSSTGGPETPVFTINGPCEVANENAAWGSVKSLYR